jgi:hypothetical protein
VDTPFILREAINWKLQQLADPHPALLEDKYFAPPWRLEIPKV